MLLAEFQRCARQCIACLLMLQCVRSSAGGPVDCPAERPGPLRTALWWARCRMMRAVNGADHHSRGVLSVFAVSRPHLRHMAAALALFRFLPPSHLRHDHHVPSVAHTDRTRLRSRVNDIQRDDVLIARDGGVAALRPDELQDACRVRGMCINGPDLSAALADWMQLTTLVGAPVCWCWC